jgi:hypothetical protein
LRPRERPFALGAQDEFLAGMANVERYARLPVPAGVLAFEEMPEEAFLQCLAVAAVEVREMRVAVDLEPFLLGARAQEAFEIAARVQSHAAPVCRRQKRGFNLFKCGSARRVVIVQQAPPSRFARNIGAVFREFVSTERRRSGHQLAGDRALCAARADAVLHACDLARIPAGQKVAENAAVTAHLAIVVGRALPDA